MYTASSILQRLLIILISSIFFMNTGMTENNNSELTRPDKFIFTDVDSLTMVSGYAGKLKRIFVGTYTYSEDWRTDPIIGSGETFAGIKTITWAEFLDKPCWMGVKPWPLNAYIAEDSLPSSIPPEKDINLCNSTQNGDTRSISVTGYVKAIKVCTTDKKDSSKNRLKGIKIWEAKLSKVPPYVRDVPGSPAKNEHKNCKIWHNKVSCPAGYIASGIKVYTDQESRYFRGLSLKCRRVSLGRSVFE